MQTIQDFFHKHYKKIDRLDLELIIARALGKTREFILAHPEALLTKKQAVLCEKLTKRRQNHEPLAYILGEKEFYGLNFKVNKDVLVPRPETELLVDAVISNLQFVIGNKNDKLVIADIGTGSGNIIISIANELKKNKLQFTNYKLLGADISEKALRVARYNAKKHIVNKKIIIFQSDLLKNKRLYNNVAIKQCNNLILLANLPYLSKKIYSKTAPDIKNFEPKSALLSGEDGLDHYKKLLKQIKTIASCSMFHVSCFMEISPEQKPKIETIIQKYFPKAKVEFRKDLAGKWRLVYFIIP